MAIKGLSKRKSLPRLGKIRLGIKEPNANGKGEHPVATAYFVVPPEVAKVFGEKPTELPIVFPVEDDTKWLQEFYRNYSSDKGLRCIGDGETCSCLVDEETGDLAGKDSTRMTWRQGGLCEGRDCIYYKTKKCSEVMNLQFLMPDVPGVGVYQIDSGSINSMLNINGAIELIRGTFHRISGIPLSLTLEDKEVVNPDDHKKKKVHVLNIRTKQTMKELMAATHRALLQVGVPEPIADERPEDMEDIPFESGEPTETAELSKEQIDKVAADINERQVAKREKKNAAGPEPAKESVKKEEPEKPAEKEPAPAKKSTPEQMTRLKFLRDNYGVQLAPYIRKQGKDIPTVSDMTFDQALAVIAEVEAFLKGKGVL